MRCNVSLSVSRLTTTVPFRVLHTALAIHLYHSACILKRHQTCPLQHVLGNDCRALDVAARSLRSFTCSQSLSSNLDVSLPDVPVAPALPLPTFVNQDGSVEALGPISAVAVDPFDGSIWILVRYEALMLSLLQVSCDTQALHFKCHVSVRLVSVQQKGGLWYSLGCMNIKVCYTLGCMNIRGGVPQYRLVLS